MNLVRLFINQVGNMKNKVILMGYYGCDLTHAQSAWTSTSRDIDDDKLERVPKLLSMLASEGHHTPFEKSSLHFLIVCDQASHIHLLKHRIGVSINAESARYKELKDNKSYLPNDWKDTLINKDFEYNADFLDTIIYKDDISWYDLLQEYTELGNKLYHYCLEDLTTVLGRKRAKESARYFKTMNSQITMDVMFNWRSFVHFLNLRNKPDAQLEIREIASRMLQLVKDIEGNPFKETIKAFNL